MNIHNNDFLKCVQTWSRYVKVFGGSFLSLPEGVFTPDLTRRRPRGRRGRDLNTDRRCFSTFPPPGFRRETSGAFRRAASVSLLPCSERRSERARSAGAPSGFRKQRRRRTLRCGRGYRLPARPPHSETEDSPNMVK